MLSHVLDWIKIEYIALCCCNSYKKSAICSCIGRNRFGLFLWLCRYCLTSTRRLMWYYKAPDRLRDYSEWGTTTRLFVFMLRQLLYWVLIQMQQQNRVMSRFCPGRFGSSEGLLGGLGWGHCFWWTKLHNVLGWFKAIWQRVDCGFWEAGWGLIQVITVMMV